MSEGFLMDLRTAELFYRVCSRYKVSRLEDRIRLMREIVRRKKAKYLRDVEGYTQGFNVVKIKAKRSPRAN